MLRKYLSLFAVLAAAAISMATSLPASATTVTGTYSNDGDSSNQATGFPNGPFGLSSTATTYSYVDFIPNQSFTYSQIQSIGATFTDTAGGAYGASPRIETVLNTGEWILTFLGTPPSFTDSNPALFTSTYSGANLDNGTNNSAYENSNTYNPFSSFNSVVGNDTVTNVYLILDGGWGGNGPQSLTLDSINVAVSGAVPEPSTWAMMLLGFAGLGFAGYRKTKKSPAFAAA